MNLGTTLLAASAAVVVCTAVRPASAATLAYWKFDNGTAGNKVPHATADGIFDGTTPDASGSGNTLSVFTTANYAGYNYRTDVPTVGLRNGSPSSLSVQNAGGNPAFMSMDHLGGAGVAGSTLNTATFPTFTVEASYKPEQFNGFRTIVGRDGRGVSTTDPNLANLYLQVRPDNAIGLLYTDVTGRTHGAFSTANTIVGFPFGTDPNGLTGRWYNVAAVSDGNRVSVYLDDTSDAALPALVASLDMTTEAGASANAADRALAVGTGGNTNYLSGAWTVGRGLYNGGHGDRAYGFIDEVRISDAALAPSQLLMAVPEPATVGVAAAAGAGLLVRRRRA